MIKITREKFKKDYGCDVLEKLIQGEEDFKSSYVKLKEMNASILSEAEADQLQQRISATELIIEKLKERLEIRKGEHR